MSEKENMLNAGSEENRKVRMNIGGTDIEVAIDGDGRVILPEELQNAMLTDMAAMQEAARPMAAEEEGKPQVPLKDEKVTDQFKGLPMRELIGAPLFAAAEAQEKLAAIALDYYNEIAYEDDGKTTRVLSFDLERPVVQDGVVLSDNNKVTVKAPFIGLVPIPSLLIDRVDVDFQMEVTETNSTTDRSNKEASTSVSSKLFGVNVGISGKVSSSRESTRSTNQTAKYQVHVTASQQPQTEGLSKLMDIMAACIEPVPTSEK